MVGSSLQTRPSWPVSSEARWPDSACSLRTAGDWHQALELEQLIDVADWAQFHGVDLELRRPEALTDALCAALEEIPFARLRCTTAAVRGCAVLRRGAKALEHWLEQGGSIPAGTCKTLRFSAPLPCRSEDREWRILQLHCAAGADGVLRLVFGLEHERCELGGVPADAHTLFVPGRPAARTPRPPLPLLVAFAALLSLLLLWATLLA